MEINIPKTYEECQKKYQRKECRDCSLAPERNCGTIRADLIRLTIE